MCTGVANRSEEWGLLRSHRFVHVSDGLGGACRSAVSRTLTPPSPCARALHARCAVRSTTSTACGNHRRGPCTTIAQDALPTLCVACSARMLPLAPPTLQFLNQVTLVTYTPQCPFVHHCLKGSNCSCLALTTVPTLRTWCCLRYMNVATACMYTVMLSDATTSQLSRHADQHMPPLPWRTPCIISAFTVIDIERATRP
jgi:hypothetical protein